MQANILYPTNNHNGVKILIRDYGKGVFEFLFARDSEIYSRFTKVKATPGARLMAIVGAPLFTEEQIKQIKARLEREAASAMNLMDAQNKLQTAVSAQAQHHSFVNEKLNG